MVKCKKNYIGEKYGHLTVVEQVDDYVSPQGKRYAVFLCECDCKRENPNKVKVRLCSIKSGLTVSCGCVRDENIRKVGKELNSKPMKDNPYLELNLIDSEHEPFGRCKVSNTDDYFMFSMSDYESLKDCCWHVVNFKNGYKRVQTNIDGKTSIPMHKLIEKEDADHISRDTLDNRRENLDFSATRIIQCQNRSISANNTSGCKGVTKNKQEKVWKSRISVNNRRVFLGSYKNKSDAIIARLKAEQKYFVERAWQKELMTKYGLL